VEVTVLGCPRQLAADLDLCAYRIIQESLTNVLKHAGPARVRVALEYRPAGLAVRIVDNGRRIGRAAGVGEVGHGLIGMRERVQMCGGTLTAGPRATGGFEVSLTLATAA
jgi:signal transduction histidine kinase